MYVCRVLEVTNRIHVCRVLEVTNRIQQTDHKCTRGAAICYTNHNQGTILIKNVANTPHGLPLLEAHMDNEASATYITLL